MSADNRDNSGQQRIPVYTVYPGGYSGNPKYGFQYNHPEAPPPKYEDVINGRTGEQRTAPPPPAGPYEGAEPAGFVFVAPVYKYSKLQRTMGAIFTIIFLFAFITILSKVLYIR